MHKLIEETNGFVGMNQPKYGHDAFGNEVVPSEDYELIPKGEELHQGDFPFNVYTGWIVGHLINKRYNHNAGSDGCWTAWQRKKENGSI